MIYNIPKQIILLSTFTMLALGTGSTCIRKQVKKELKKRRSADLQAAPRSGVSSIEAANIKMEVDKSKKTSTIEGEEKLDKIIAALSNKNISEEEIEAMIKRAIDALQEAQEQREAKSSIPQSASQRRFHDYQSKEDLSPSSPPLSYETMAENYRTATPDIRERTGEKFPDYHSEEDLLPSPPPPPYEGVTKNTDYTATPDIKEPLRNRAYSLIRELRNVLKYKKYSRYECTALQKELNEVNAVVSVLTKELFSLQMEQQAIEKRNVETQQLVKTPAPSKHIKLQRAVDKSYKKDIKRILKDIKDIEDKIKIKQIKIGYLKRYLSKVDTKSD